VTEPRHVTSPLEMPELVTNPRAPNPMVLSDDLDQVIAMLTGMRYGRRRLLKVDHADRLLVCPSGQDANRVTQTRGLAAALPATIVFQPDTVAWAIDLTAGGIEVDLQDAAGVSYGAFTIQREGTWEMHHPCAQVVLTASAWTAAAASHWAVIEWRRM